MNTTEHYVTEVLGLPYKLYDRWWVKVLANSYGHIEENTIMCKDQEHALSIKVGYKYDA
jgi:hypothetical protein